MGHAKSNIEAFGSELEDVKSSVCRGKSTIHAAVQLCHFLFSLLVDERHDAAANDYEIGAAEVRAKCQCSEDVRNVGTETSGGRAYHRYAALGSAIEYRRWY
jgi:hypothetical protein